jgi:hypothetical protein
MDSDISDIDSIPSSLIDMIQSKLQSLNEHNNQILETEKSVESLSKMSLKDDTVNSSCVTPIEGNEKIDYCYLYSKWQSVNQLTVNEYEPGEGISSHIGIKISR